jgi:hypothetical protein
MWEEMFIIKLEKVLLNTIFFSLRTVSRGTMMVMGSYGEKKSGGIFS